MSSSTRTHNHGHSYEQLHGLLKQKELWLDTKALLTKGQGRQARLETLAKLEFQLARLKNRTLEV